MVGADTAATTDPHIINPTTHSPSSTNHPMGSVEPPDIRGPGGLRNDPEIQPMQRMLAACSGSLLTSLLVTPLDVVRVRLQAQHPTTLAHAPQNLTNTISSLRAQKFPLSFSHATSVSPELGVTACCREVFWVNNTAEACFATSALTDSCVVEQTARRRFEGTWEGLVKIARYEGVSSLWRGLSPTLLMAIPANVIYFTGYDYLRSSGSSPFASLGPTLAPLLAGSAARAIAATVISPLEMFKTRLQATSTHTHSSGAFRETLHGITRMVSTEGPLTLWRGLELTLWRDVPFSGLYWFGYEVIKDALRLRRERQSAQMHNDIFARASEQRKEELHSEATFTDSFVAGASSGAVAALLTTPFDVGKTRRQIAHSKGVDGPGSMPKVLMEIWREGGVRSLWKGCTPRMLKVAPACAIMISSYEMGKKMAAGINDRRANERA